MGKRSVFVEARKSQGRQGLPALSVLQEIEEKERESRVSKMNSIMARATKNAEEGGAGRKPILPWMNVDYEKYKEEFPVEIMFFSQEDEEFIAEQYKKFEEMYNILDDMKDNRANLSNRKLVAEQELIRTMYKIYAEGVPLPTWLKGCLGRIHKDPKFGDYARNYWEEQGDEAEPVDFEDFVEAEDPAEIARRSGIFKEAKVASLDTSVNTSAKIHSAEEQQKINSRKASAMLTINKKDMARLDSRKQSLEGGSGNRRASRKLSMATVGQALIGMNRKR
ncbi:Oidioi.mRNA.OKI2018_I69.XSR.g16500.t1.cds [Oikopleura dioica]|uniref:Oidioi.mRNA.OKI2018_I69.XSR.g16500.t1.cds n=1 Tax=Oikopleura dioica TaxID=34765 RepID=A0ABN7SGA0_OIKDI|nr:Oidioi.mRNA.OKI2018_I69.XSR.g16500.t1.cds [Oikopleura dioica]